MESSMALISAVLVRFVMDAVFEFKVNMIGGKLRNMQKMRPLNGP